MTVYFCYNGNKISKLFGVILMVNVRVLGTGPIGNGYAEILGNHPEVSNVEQLDSSSAPTHSADVVIAAVPHDAEAELAEKYIGECEIFLGAAGAGRLATPEDYKRWYGEDHPAPDTLPAVYGSPEYNREELKSASYISVPGCYPTASGLAFRPLEENGLLVPESVIEVHADSGYSGGGKRALEREETADAELYDIGQDHRHVGEMQRFTGGRPVLFVPKVYRNISDGLLAVVTADLVEGAEEGDVQKALVDRYEEEPFVKVLEPGAKPLNHQIAVGTDLCIIAAKVVLGRALIMAAIDNTRKGGSSQGVHCMNIRLGLDETAGLTPKSAVS